MKAIREYLNLQQAKRIQKKLKTTLPTNYECIISYDGRSYHGWEMKIKSKYPTRDISFKEDDIKEIINLFVDACKRYYINFTISRYGGDELYISVELKR